MRVDAHLEQAGEEQQAHGEPCDGFEPFLYGFDQSEVVGRFERFRRGGQDQNGNGNDTPDPGDRGEEMQPECERQRPGGRSCQRHGVGVSEGTISRVFVGTTSTVFVGTTTPPSVVAVTVTADPGVAVAG